jgi:hypothetical protein
MIPFYPARTRLVAVVASVAIAVMLTLAACKTFDNAGADETIATINERIAVMDKAAVDPEKTPEQREIAALKAKQYRDDLAKVKELAEEDAADDGPDPMETAATGIGNAVAAAVPGFGAAIALGVPLFFRVRKQVREHKRAEELERIRAEHAMKALTQTVVSIENAKGLVPAFAEAWGAAKLAVEAKQDESTKQVIEKIKTDSL